MHAFQIVISAAVKLQALPRPPALFTPLTHILKLQLLLIILLRVYAWEIVDAAYIDFFPKISTLTHIVPTMRARDLR
jgi:hypothetical protein